MKSESAIRRQIAVIKKKRNEATGIREIAAIDALIGGLKWVVNIEGFSPESHVIDAMIDDLHANDEYNGTLNDFLGE